MKWVVRIEVDATGSGGFVIAAFVMSGVQSTLGLFQQRNSKIPNLATNMPTDTVDNYFGRGLILESSHKCDAIL